MLCSGSGGGDRRVSCRGRERENGRKRKRKGESVCCHREEPRRESVLRR